MAWTWRKWDWVYDFYYKVISGEVHQISFVSLKSNKAPLTFYCRANSSITMRLASIFEGFLVRLRLLSGWWQNYLGRLKNKKQHCHCFQPPPHPRRTLHKSENLDLKPTNQLPIQWTTQVIWDHWDLRITGLYYYFRPNIQT